MANTTLGVDIRVNECATHGEFHVVATFDTPSKDVAQDLVLRLQQIVRDFGVDTTKGVEENVNFLPTSVFTTPQNQA